MFGQRFVLRRCQPLAWTWRSLVLKSGPFIRIARSWHLSKGTPASRIFGYDRGHQSIARYYIDSFIAEYAQDIRGRVLELGDDSYMQRFGNDGITCADVLNVTPGSKRTTVIADLTRPNQLKSDYYDCVILTQTLQFIYDFKSAIECILRILAPGGVLLATMSGISQISRYDMDRWGEYWRFTTASARRSFAEVFPSNTLTVKAYGNVLAASALLHGLASCELSSLELDHLDPDYEVIIAARAVKPSRQELP
jgi:SAM-dependent methyltransferase